MTLGSKPNALGLSNCPYWTEKLPELRLENLKIWAILNCKQCKHLLLPLEMTLGSKPNTCDNAVIVAPLSFLCSTGMMCYWITWQCVQSRWTPVKCVYVESQADRSDGVPPRVPLQLSRNYFDKLYYLKMFNFLFSRRRQCARTSCEGLNSSQNECNKTKFTSNWSLSNWSTNVRSLWWIYFQKQIYLNTHFISTEWSQAKINLIFTWFCMHHV